MLVTICSLQVIVFTVFELFDNWTTYEIFVPDPWGIRDRNMTNWCYKCNGTKWVIIIILNNITTVIIANRVWNLNFLFGVNRSLWGSGRSYNLDIVSIPVMFSDWHCILISPVTNSTSYSDILMSPNMG